MSMRKHVKFNDMDLTSMVCVLTAISSLRSDDWASVTIGVIAVALAFASARLAGTKDAASWFTQASERFDQ